MGWHETGSEISSMGSIGNKAWKTRMSATWSLTVLLSLCHRLVNYCRIPSEIAAPTGPICTIEVLGNFKNSKYIFTVGTLIHGLIEYSGC